MSVSNLVPVKVVYRNIYNKQNEKEYTFPFLKVKSKYFRQNPLTSHLNMFSTITVFTKEDEQLIEIGQSRCTPYINGEPGNRVKEEVLICFFNQEDSLKKVIEFESKRELSVVIEKVNEKGIF